jgi:hypothetical protein
LPRQPHAAQEASDIYWNAQRQETTGRGDEALKSYAKLLARSPDSEAAASNLLNAAVREGSFHRCASCSEGCAKGETGRQRCTAFDSCRCLSPEEVGEADRTLIDLEAEGDFAFMMPMLKGWLNVAQGRDSGVDAQTFQSSGLTAYYSDDQLDLLRSCRAQYCAGKITAAKFQGL